MPAAILYTLGVHSCHDALTAEQSGSFVDEFRIAHGSRIDANFITAGTQRIAHIVDAADAAADGQRHKDDLGSAAHDIEHGGAPFVAGGDIEKDDLIGATVAVLLRQSHRIADFFDTDKIHALDDLAVAYVQTRNNAFRKHTHASFARASASSRESVPS